MEASLGPPAGEVSLSLETGSQVEDPADPAAEWLLDSPAHVAPHSLRSSPAAGVVHDSEVSSAGVVLGLQQPAAALEVMRRSLAREEVLPVAMGLHKEMTAVVSLARGKRTKVLTTETIRTKTAPATGSRVRKSSRLKGSTSATTSLERAKRLAAERNLDSGKGTDDFSVLDLHSDSHLSSVIADSCVVFVPSAGSPVEALSIIRAKGKVQAALAQAALRKEAEAAARSAREANASLAPVLEEVGASSRSAAAGGDPLPASAGSGPEGCAALTVCEAPREGAIASPPFVPRSSRRGKAVSTRVTRSTLAVRKGRGGKQKSK
jgi:hypothetical protein